MTWAQRVRAVFSTPSEFVSPEAEKSDLLLEALEGQAEASVRAEYEPQVQKLRDELDRLKQKASPHFSVDFFAGIPVPRGESILPQAMLDDIEQLRKAERAKFAMGHFVTEPEKSVAQTVLDSLCSLMSCGADEVVGLVTEYRAAYDRYSVLADRLGVELSRLNADREVTQAFDDLRAHESAFTYLLKSLGVPNAHDAVTEFSRLKEQITDVENHNIALRRQNEELLARIDELSKPTVTFNADASEAIAAIESASAALNVAATPSEAPSEGEKPTAETDALRKLDWVEMTQVFRELVKLDSLEKITIPKFNLTNADVRCFAQVYHDEIRRYRKATSPQKGGHIQQFSAARRAEEWRPKGPK
jgi:Cu/Ag efflux protein CusF